MLLHSPRSRCRSVDMLSPSSVQLSPSVVPPWMRPSLHMKPLPPDDTFQARLALLLEHLNVAAISKSNLESQVTFILNPGDSHSYQTMIHEAVGKYLQANAKAIDKGVAPFNTYFEEDDSEQSTMMEMTLNFKEYASKLKDGNRDPI